MNKTIVVNIYKDKYDVYIGRQRDSKVFGFGNPFVIGKDGDRNTVIEKFKKYFYKRIQEDEEFKKEVFKLNGKILGCFCKPKSCHGDIICDYLNSQLTCYRKQGKTNKTITEPIILGVVGTRTFNNYQYMQTILNRYNVKKIVSGGAQGADKLAELYASENDIPLKIFLPDWNTFGKSAGYKRNVKIVDASDEIVAFWDNKSKGTRLTINIAKEKNKPVHVYTEQ